jgi:hypothetical protein
MVPGVLVLLTLVIAAGRLSAATGALEQAAAAGAREASLSRSVDAATTAAAGSVRRNLAAQGLQCDGLQIDVDAAPLRQRAGHVGDVAVTVGCAVPLADLAVPGLPGSRRIEATGISPVDVYRGR